MASWVVRFTSSGDDYTTDVDLIDTIGPLNEWTSSKPGAFSNRTGRFTNQTRRAVDQARDWILDDIDIDDDLLNKEGSGSCDDNNAGDFPKGELTWKVVRRI